MSPSSLRPFALCTHFRRRREALRLGRGKLAVLAGFKNASRGARRICDFEERGIIYADLLVKLMAILSVDQQTVDRLLAEDEREGFRQWNRWANESVRPFVGVCRSGPMPISTAVPNDITDLPEAEVFAADFARRMKSPVRLHWSRRHVVLLDAEGEVVDRIESCGLAWPFIPLILGDGRRRS